MRRPNVALSRVRGEKTITLAASPSPACQFVASAALDTASLKQRPYRSDEGRPVTFSRRHAYATSNVLKVVKTPGGRLVGAYRSKKRQGPKCATAARRSRASSTSRRSPTKTHKPRRLSRAPAAAAAPSAWQRVVRAFLIEEQKIVKQMMIEKQKKTK